MEFGYELGEVCNRDNCKGIVEQRKVEGCSCHISPPCSACTEDKSFCPECGWQGKDDFIMNDFRVNEGSDGILRHWEPRKLNTSKIDWHSKPHTNSTMIKEGVYPTGTLISDVRKLVNGTFGGRFEYFESGKFRFIAYTD